MILSEMRWTSMTFSIHFSASRMPVPPWPDFWAQKKNLNLEFLPFSRRAWLGARPPFHLCSCIPQKSTPLLVNVSTISALLRDRVPTFQVAALSLVHEKEIKLAGPTGNFAGPAPFLVASGHGPVLNAKTDFIQCIVFRELGPKWFTSNLLLRFSVKLQDGCVFWPWGASTRPGHQQWHVLAPELRPRCCGLHSRCRWRVR